MPDVPRLETERLILRAIDPERDFEPWAAFHADAAATRYVGGPLDRPNAWRKMCTTIGHWCVRGFGFFSLEEKSSGHWVGRVGGHYPEGWPDREIGWMIVPAAWGKGYAPEAAAAAMDWVFEELGWERAVHLIDADNAASVRVAEKLGSRRIGHEPSLAGIGEPCDIYGQTREAWRASRARR